MSESLKGDPAARCADLGNGRHLRAGEDLAPQPEAIKVRTGHPAAPEAVASNLPPFSIWQRSAFLGLNRMSETGAEPTRDRRRSKAGVSPT